MKVSKECYLVGQNTTCKFWGWSPLSGYKTTLKQQLNGEKQWKMRWRAKPLICSFEHFMCFRMLAVILVSDFCFQIKKTLHYFWPSKVTECSDKLAWMPPHFKSCYKPHRATTQKHPQRSKVKGHLSHAWKVSIGIKVSLFDSSCILTSCQLHRVTAISKCTFQNFPCANPFSSQLYNWQN